MTSRLLVLVPDRVSDWVAKGEVVDRYFNPGDLFDEVHLVLTNDDRPDPVALQRLAGRASIEVHNVPSGALLFAATLGWRPLLLRPWSRRVVALADRLQPDLVRCHGVRVNAVAALDVKRRLGVPYVVSLHINPDVDHLRSARSGWARRLAGRLVEPAERAALRGADCVVAVYEPIVPYLRRLGVERYRVLYNVVGHDARPKTSWARGVRLRVVTVGRLTPGEKDPRPLVDAVAQLPEVELTIVGDGPLAPEVRAAVRGLGVDDRVHLVGARPNDEVLRLLAEADVFAYHSLLYEVSKAVIEACLTGLPVVTNDRGGEPAPELAGRHVLLVDGTSAGFRDALARLADDEPERERLGRAALAHAQRWRPEVTEARYADLYRELRR